MAEVFPSHLPMRKMAPAQRDPRPYPTLMAGEVLAIVYPDDDKSVSGKYIEYRVAAQAYVRGQAATVEIPHAVLMDFVGGAADHGTMVLRADPEAGKDGQPGTGSKVLVLCIGGDPNNAMIVGFARDRDNGDDIAEDDGLVFAWEYNGVSIGIDGDGAVTIERKGPTTPDGELDTDRVQDEERGQSITLEADGSFEVHTKRGDDVEQRIRLDQADKTMTIETSDGLTVQAKKGPVSLESADGGMQLTADKDNLELTSQEGDLIASAPGGAIKLGSSAQEPVPLGQTLAQLLHQILAQIQAISVPTAVGPSGPPLNAPAFQALDAQVDQILSQAAFVAKTP